MLSRISHYDQANTAAGCAASGDPRVHVGLGAAARVQTIEIRWPSGIRQLLRDVEPDRVIRVEEPANEAMRILVLLSGLASRESVLRVEKPPKQVSQQRLGPLRP